MGDVLPTEKHPKKGRIWASFYWRICKLWLITGFRREVQRERAVSAQTVAGTVNDDCCSDLPRKIKTGWRYLLLTSNTNAIPPSPSSSPPPLRFLFDLKNIKNIKSHLFVLKSLLQDFSGLRLRASLPIVQSNKCTRVKKKGRRISNSIN